MRDIIDGIGIALVIVIAIIVALLCVTIMLFFSGITLCKNVGKYFIGKFSNAKMDRKNIIGT
jgi:hypothetical protein